MLRDESAFVPIADERGKFLGVAYADDILEALAADRIPKDIGAIACTQIPTCTRASTLVDAVRQMISCFVRRIPVVGEAGELIGMLTLSEAGAAAVRDPAVAEVFERFAGSPSLFARRMR